MDFADLKGCTFSSVENVNNEELIFTLVSGEKHKLYHKQDCCEYVYIEDIIGELDDLLNTPILLAEEVSSGDTPEGKEELVRGETSYTWTFYKLATIKGYVTIRWFGSSNGYYSESVDFR